MALTVDFSRAVDDKVIYNDMTTVLQRINDTRTKYGLSTCSIKATSDNTITVDDFITFKSAIEESKTKCGATTDLTGLAIAAGDIIKPNYLNLAYSKTTDIYNYCSCQGACTCEDKCDCESYVPCSCDGYTPCSCVGYTPCSCDSYIPCTCESLGCSCVAFNSGDCPGGGW